MALTQIDAGAIQNNAITTAQLATNTEFVFTNVAVDVITSKTQDTDLTISANGTGVVRISDDLVVTGNVTFSGSATRVDTEVITLADNIIELNSNYTSGTPTENAGVSVVRGSEANVAIRWNETDDQWEYTNDGDVYNALGSGGGESLVTSYTPGTLVTGESNNITRWYPNRAIQVSEVLGRVLTPGTANVVVDIRVSGETVDTLNISGTDLTSSNTGFTTTANDYVTVIITHNGLFAADLYVSFIYNLA